AGLGVALAAEDRAPRGAALVAQAIDLATSRGEPTAAMHLALARILGENLGDRPAAVARLRAVPDEANEAIEARALEGRYRAALGDDAGATLAFARLRERAGRDASAVAWLVEAARFEETRGDLAAAQRHLAAAVAMRPHDATLAAHYRDVGQRLASHAGIVPLPVRATEDEASGESDRAAEPRQSAITAPSGAWRSEPGTRPWDGLAEVADEDYDTDIADEARVEELTRKVQADPTNESVVEELCVLLTKLDRGMELLALLSARLEDAPPDRRDELLPRHRQVLARLEAQARAAGRDAEADLFRAALDST
ncbi:MAG TPA: hypothetical protein VIF62_11850, partial [Labilithrix sp.]